MMMKRCGKCGYDFVCGSPAPGCWCESVHVSCERMTELKRKYRDCLCPACLRD